MHRPRNELGIKRKICTVNAAVKNTKKQFTSNEINKTREVKVKLGYISATFRCQTPLQRFP